MFAILIKIALASVSAFWERCFILSWVLIAICLVAFAILVFGTFWQVGTAAELLTNYGTVLVLAIIALTGVAGVKTFSAR